MTTQVEMYELAELRAAVNELQKERDFWRQSYETMKGLHDRAVELVTKYQGLIEKVTS